MKQIFDRFSRYIKSEINSSKYDNINSYSVDENDELKKIIDELENKKAHQKNHSYEQKTQETKSRKMTLTDAFFILGIKENASKEEIKTAYKKRINEYHPDKVAALGQELQELAGKRTLEINEAYQLMKQHGKI